MAGLVQTWAVLLRFLVNVGEVQALYQPDQGQRGMLEVDAQPSSAGGMRDETDEYTTDAPAAVTTGHPEQDTTTDAPTGVETNETQETTTDAPTDAEAEQPFSFVEIRTISDEDENLTTAAPPYNLTTPVPIAVASTHPADKPDHHEALASDLHPEALAPAALELPAELRGFAKYASADVEADFAPFEKDETQETTALPVDFEANITSSVLNVTSPRSSLLNSTDETVLELPADVDLYAKYADLNVDGVFEMEPARRLDPDSSSEEALVETSTSYFPGGPTMGGASDPIVVSTPTADPTIPGRSYPTIPASTTPCTLCTDCTADATAATTASDCTEACRICNR